MTRKRTRGLTEEERALWQKVTRDDRRLEPERAQPLADLPRAVAPEPGPRLPAVPPFRLGSLASDTSLGHDLAGPWSQRLAEAPLRMDRRRFGKMTKGKLEPEARIDLHGMTLAAAQPALTRFILGARARGLRLVLVITGKGKARDAGGPIPARRGALRHEVPHWLQAAPLSDAVLQIAPAHRRHGGEGAYYVYLRRAL